MGNTGENKRSGVEVKSETAILHQFQLDICRKDKGKCPFWNNGCTTNQRACKKWTQYRNRERRKEKEALENEKKEMMKSDNISRSYVSKFLKEVRNDMGRASSLIYTDRTLCNDVLNELSCKISELIKKIDA